MACARCRDLRLRNFCPFDSSTFIGSFLSRGPFRSGLLSGGPFCRGFLCGGSLRSGLLRGDLCSRKLGFRRGRLRSQSFGLGYYRADNSVDAVSAILGGLLLSLKNEVVRKNPLARVNAVAPGWTESPMTRGHVSEEQVRKVSRTMALRKVAQPEDVANQVVVLASPVLSGHVTGQVVTVAGGMEGRVIHE